MMSSRDVCSLVIAHLPDYRVDSVVHLGEGLDNRAYEVNGELIVRFSKELDPGRLDREARLLAAVADVSPLSVPVHRRSLSRSGAVWRTSSSPLVVAGARLGG
jgi:hypothetical protein